MTDPVKGYQYYMSVIPINKITKNGAYLVRTLDEKHKNDLKSKIQDQGLIEPITVHREQNGEFVLIAGQHRLVALEELEAIEVPAKIYVGLDESAKRVIGYMSNESRKRPSAGKRYEALSEIFDASLSKLRKSDDKIPSEEQVINQLYFSSKAMPVNELVLGITIDKLRNDSQSLVEKYELIQDAQVPRKKIEEEIMAGKYPLLTAQNTFAALMQLCRSKPVTQKEEDEGKNYRRQEYVNVREFFNRIVTEFIQPWINVGQIETVVNFCRRYPFEAFTRIVHDLLVEDGLPATSSKASPFYHDGEVNWDKLFSRLAPFKDSKLWQDRRIEDERSVADLKSRLRYILENGEFPDY